jgi:signal transduction histidine kinase
MPSIRRSLIVYFLLLLALALTGMALLADGVTGNALAEKEKATAERIDRNAAEREREERDKFDRELLTQAKVVARTAGSEYTSQLDQANRRLAIVSAVSALGTSPALAPTAGLGVITNTASSPVQTRRGTSYSPLWGLVSQSVYSPLKIDEFLIRNLEEDDHGGQLIQIHSSRGLVWKSSHLPAQGLPFDREAADEAGDDPQFDNIALPNGSGRRVTYKSGPVGGFRYGWGGWGGPPRSDPRPNPTQRDAQPPPRPGPPPGFVNYYQVARPTVELDATIDIIRASAEERKAAEVQSTAGTRRWVRVLLTAGSVFAFLGLLVGGWLVVGLGLRPLQKLTNAVAKVNEKDLHLPVAAGELSHELAPIHHRLAQTLDQLREAFEREKQAVADISHELRTPVASLLATIDITLRKPRTADQYKQALEDCRVLTKQLGGLVERVMTLAYLDAGQTNVTSAPTDATDLASGCASLIRPLAESHGLTLTTDLRPTPPLDTDADKLREVVINLLHNAVEYNRPGGSITLAVRREQNGGPLVVEVTDTGIGMTADVRGRIFERFYRADASRTATGVHAGLGLSIVKEYVTRLGGTISVESEVDRGSTFRVTLPG